MYNGRQILLGDVMDLLHTETEMKVLEWCTEERYGVFSHDNPIPEEMNEFRVISIKHTDDMLIVNIIGIKQNNTNK